MQRLGGSKKHHHRRVVFVFGRRGVSTLEVAVQGRALGCCIWTPGTFVRLLTRVSPHVLLKRHCSLRCIVADSAAERASRFVALHVLHQVAFLPRRIAAFGTREQAGGFRDVRLELLVFRLGFPNSALIQCHRTCQCTCPGTRQPCFQTFVRRRHWRHCSSAPRWWADWRRCEAWLTLRTISATTISIRKSQNVEAMKATSAAASHGWSCAPGRRVGIGTGGDVTPVATSQTMLVAKHASAGRSRFRMMRLLAALRLGDGDSAR